MKYFLGIAAVLVVLLVALAIRGAGTAPKTARVQVHCPDGQRAGFVTPARVRIAVGDSIAWRMTGQVTSDSLIIALKDTVQVWPFAGKPPRGGESAVAQKAERKGTYPYSVTLDCRAAGGPARRVVIDPDLIIE